VKLKKTMYIISVVCFAIFVLSAILVLTNTLNSWLAGILSLSISVICFMMPKIIKNNKMAD